MEFTYKEYKPSPLLRDYVEAFVLIGWKSPEGADSPVQRCLPHGTPGLLIHIGQGRSFYMDNEREVIHPEAYFVGVVTEAAQWRMTSGTVKFGVRFTPEGIIRLFEEPLADCYNYFVDADSYFNKKLTSVISRIQDASTDEQRIFVMENYLYNRIRNLETQRNYLAESLRIIRSSAHDLSMKELSKQVFVCERQLQRMFKNSLGVSPKYYQRINRFNKALQFTEATGSDWSQVAYSFGYSDQAHYIRDFKEFTGETPVRFFAQGRA